MTSKFLRVEKKIKILVKKKMFAWKKKILLKNIFSWRNKLMTPFQKKCFLMENNFFSLVII